MKHLKIVFLLPFLLLWGCTDKLDLTPAGEISEDIALNTPAKIQAALIGAYDNMSIEQLYGGRLIIGTELLGADDEIFWQGTFSDPGEMYEKRITTVNATVTDIWIEAYFTINVLNNVLASLEVVKDEDDKARIEGEALFLRSYIYFDLTRLYGKPYSTGSSATNLGVPLVLTPTKGVSDADYKARNTVEECYAQIIADLVKAETITPVTNSFFVTKGAVNALLSRVYLSKGDYTAASAAATKVISSGEYSLPANLADVFAKETNTAEDIFAIQIRTTDPNNDNDVADFFASPTKGGRGDIPVLAAHLELFEAGDKRRSFFYEEDNDRWTSKWTNLFGNVNLIRYAEVILNRAESNFRLGNTEAAVTDINLLRSRANASLYNSSTLTLEEILLERRRELAFEGHRLHDFKRTKKSIGDLPYDDKNLVLPIPQREMNVNNKLVQNEGYN
jgi:hypothetical protein